jgi:hypothetical protein
MPKTINWSLVIAVVSGLAGVAGSVITPIYGAALAGQVQAVLQAVSGLLVLVAGFHATGVVAAASKARYAAAVKNAARRPLS